MKGYTQEEEEKEMWNTFKEIADLGYPHIHCLRVIPSDGRADSAYRSELLSMTSLGLGNLQLLQIPFHSNARSACSHFELIKSNILF